MSSPSATRMSIVSYSPAAFSTVAAVWRVPERERRTAHAVGVGEADGADERVRVPARRGDHVDLVAELEVVVLGRGLVDGDFVGTLRRRGPGAARSRRRRRRPRSAPNIGAPPVETASPSASMIWALRWTLPWARSTPGHGRDRLDEVGRDRVAGAEVAGFAEGERGADLEVGLLVRRAEQRVEPGAHAVGEHERADDERDGEDDGDGDRDQAPDARPDAAARQQQCGVATHDGQSPIRFKRSSTASGVGSCISSTMRPSLRKTTRSAYDGGARVVGDHHDRLAVLPHGTAHEVEDLGAGSRVEVAGRLVGEHDVGPGVEGPGDRDALLLAAGELARTVLQAVGETDRLDDLVEPLTVDGVAAEHQRQRDVLLGGQRRDQVVGLEDEPDGLAPELGELLVVELGEVGVADEDRAGRRACRGRRGSASACSCRSRTVP